MNLPPRHPLLLVVSAPSGAGKTTLCSRLLRECPDLERVVTCTTRAPRRGETNGRDYLFLSAADFARRAAAGDFLEYAEVHGARYGTPRRPVEAALRAGRDTLLVIDVQGAARVRRALRRTDARLPRALFADVLIAPPSLEALARRLRRRAKDSPASIERRLRNAPAELARWPEFQFLVINDRLRQAYVQLRAIVVAAHCRILNDESRRRPSGPRP